MTSPRVVERGLGAGPSRELDGATWCYVNMFSTSARPVLDELFEVRSVRERPSTLAFPTKALAPLSLSQSARCDVPRCSSGITHGHSFYAFRGPKVAVTRSNNLQE